MKLSENSHRLVEDFFRDYFEDESFILPKIYLYTGKITAFFTLISKSNGITFGKRIFIMPQLLSSNTKNQKKLPEDLIVHEIMHVIQYQKKGFLKFLYMYLRDYWRNLQLHEKWDADSRRQAYLNIPFEIEAREAAKDFLEWKENRIEGE
ncbi:MAG TPA: hypothetical protein VF556_09645 [Pyrinomonadaceae bacterium]|jgi:quinol monooxygenase YgiN